MQARTTPKAIAGLIAMAMMIGDTAMASVDRVTVYPNGATVQQTIETTPNKAGVVTIDHLTHTLNPDSVRVEPVTERVRIIRTNIEKVHNGKLDPEKTSTLEAKLDQLRSKKTETKNEIETLNQELDFLKRIAKAVPKAVQRDKTQIAWTKAGEELRTRIQAALNQRSQAQERRTDLTEKIEELSRKIDGLKDGESRGHYRVRVELQREAERREAVRIALRYNVDQTSWRPVHNVRLDTEQQKVEVASYAKVTQLTGMDWMDVHLEFGINRPELGTAAPALTTWRLDVAPSRAAPEAAVSDSASLAQDAYKKSEGRAQTTTSRQVRADFARTGYSGSYEIDTPVTIPGDGDEQRLLIRKDTFDADVLAEITPQQQERAFLSARFTNTAEAPILTGRAQLFRDGNFVGEHQISEIGPGEDHTLGFGVDDAIEVTHRTVRKKREREGFGVIEDKDRHVRRYITRVENGHQRSIDVSIRQRQPVSQDDRVDVEMLDWSDAPTTRSVDDRQGVMAWDRTLDAGGSTAIRFGYSVTHPEELRVPPFPQR